jgi:hypothetical protein
LAIAFLGFASSAVIAGNFSNVVQRQTNDRNLDLVDSLVLLQRHQEAIEICAAQLDSVDPRSDDAAKWAIRFSNVLTSQLESTGKFTESSIAKSKQPVAQLLSAYPNHPRKFFLEACLARIQAAASRHAVVVYSVSPASETRLEAVFTELSRSTRRFEELVLAIENERAKLDSTADSLKKQSLSSDLHRLSNELQVQIVGLTLLQTDVFPDASRDQVAAAGKALQSANLALDKLPTDSLARLEIQRLRVQALLRSGDLAQAETSLSELAQELDQPIPNRVFALRIHLDLAQGKLSDADKRLRAWYGEDLSESPRSIEMDLARQAYLVEAKDKSVGNWLELIEARNGAFARRRAEAASLGKLRGSSTSNAIDPAILAAQGADRLRRGEPARAAALLSASAKAESRDDLAVTRSLEAAAAFQQAKMPTDAAKILVDIALAHPTASQSADAHLQAAVVVSADVSGDDAKRVEKILRQNSSTWPDSEAANKARRWLLTLLERQGRLREAAQTATTFLTINSSASEIDDALLRWSNYVRNSDRGSVTQRINEFRNEMTPVLSLPAVAERYRFAAVYLLDRTELSQVQLNDQEPAGLDEFTQSLGNFRQQTVLSNSLGVPPSDLIDAARWRLMRDGKQDPKRRQAIAAVLTHWGGDWSDQIPLLVWAGQFDDAHQLAEQTASQDEYPARIWRRLAQSLAQSSQEEAKRRGVKIWDRIATGLPKNSDDWHQAKLAAIDLLLALGDRQEATRRAKYILLTAAPKDAKTWRRYQSAAELRP